MKKEAIVHPGLLLCFALLLLQAPGCGNGGGGDGDAGEDDATEGTDGSENDAVDDAVEEDDGRTQDAENDAQSDIPEDPWYSEVCNIVQCQAHIYECGDCEDNDSDERIDSKDHDCLGPCDNNESGFNTLIPGGASAPCKLDCYFDQDSGGGNDDCNWDQRCDELQPSAPNPCDYESTCTNCDCDVWYETQSDQCLDFCLPLVPNGCDCFGCCELEAESGDHVFIGTPGCTLESPENCDPCTFVPSCYNECGHCEICIGKPELPDDCTTEDRCPPGVQPCGLPGDDPCPPGYYCITGCCVEVII